ncbi:MAG: Gfo/Idh/MocA family oxidoreductase [Geminicoccaceae bacterium]|nr:Gfo/Idh/MocA family oxidoreductase [Geminicoccaceae bacterium]
MTLRGAVIGCGFFAQNHLKAWGDVEGAQLVAVCDRDAAKAGTAGDLTGATPFTDAQAMFEAMDLDFVDIATTMETHEALVELATRHGVPCICQKPFAPDIAAVQRILATVEAAGLPIMVHENFRFQTPMIELRRAMARIGEPFFAHVSWCTGYDVVAGQPYLNDVERFIILDLGIHVLDIARFLMGDATSIHCRTQRTHPTARGEATAVMVLEHQGGALSEVVCSYTTRIDPDPFPQTLVEIDGTKGSLRLLRDYVLEIHEPDGIERLDVSPTVPAWADPQWALVQESVLNTQQHWVNCLRGNVVPATSGRDNLKTFTLVEAAYASAQDGRAVNPAKIAG